VGFVAIFEHFSGLEFFFSSQAESTPAPAQVTQTVRQFLAKQDNSKLTHIMSSSEKYVHDLFLNQYRIPLIKMDDFDGRYGKEPDFEYCENNKRIFVCELKEYETINPSEKDGWEITHHPDGSVESTRNNIAPSKISWNILCAYDQLKKYSEPKILIFLNHYPGYDIRDLEETYRGFSEYVIGDRKIKDVYYKQASESVKEEKTKIDLYIWIDASDKNMSLERDEIYLRTVTVIGQEIAKKYFSILDKK